MHTRVARGCFAAWILVVTGLYFVFPDARVFTWGAIGLSGAGAVVAGSARLPRARRRPWLLLAAALMLFITGDIYYYAVQALGHEPAFPGLADVFYVLVYPAMAASLALFVRARSGGGNRAALLDALVPTVGLGLLCWVYLIAPYARADDLTVVQKVVASTYPLGDVLALALLLRLFTAPGRKPAALRLLAVSVVGLLLSDVAYGLARLDSTWATGGPIELGWVLYYGGAGLAALNPSMAGLAEARVPGTEPATRGRRLVLLTAAAMIAPGVLLAEHVAGDGVPDAPVVAAGSALVFLLVMARVGGLLTAQRQAHQRERVLREANAALAEASGRGEAGAALRTAIARLMPGPDAYRLVIDSATEIATSAPHPVLAVADLPAEVAAQLGGFDYALYACPVVGAAAHRHGSAYLAADPALLAELSPVLSGLFQQVGMVLERIDLAAEISRRDGETYFRTLIQSASDVILIVGAEDEIRYATPSAGTVFGYPDLAGEPLRTLIADTHHEVLHDVLAQARRGHGLDGVDLTAMCADRRLLQIECDARDLSADPSVAGLVLTLRDVTERRRLENDLTHQAFHDELTGLSNRVLFRDRLEHAFGRADRDDSVLGVIFIDLDDFKEINDTLGHAIGDQLLVAVAGRISHAIGAHNTASRMGGDEFAILVEQAQDLDAAEEVAARIVAALSVPVELSDGLGGAHVVSGAASAGVATSRDAETATELLRHADMALYLAKDAGKGTWQPYRSDLHAAMMERVELRTALHEAVEARQFVLQYQPIVDLLDGGLAGVESLVRWQHPTRGLLGPNHFIEVAEENGAIVGIGAWVLRESLRQFTAWRALDPESRLQYVSVNVSARQFRTPGFMAQVRAALADTGCRPEWLLLEITESLVLRDAEQVWADLRGLRKLGVRIAIDDFGTGYSSLSYLRQMPVDVLKVDKSFIDDVLGSRQQRALVNAIVTLARNLDLAVVAEGIEDAGQRALLARMGCPYGQGYLFSRPVWPDEVAARLRTGERVA